MSIVRIVGLATLCAIALVDSAFAGTGTWVPIPGPIAGAGIPGLIAAGVAAYAWYRRRK